MKKITFALSLALFLFVGFTAGAQQARYYYYPASNVYLDPAKQLYIYPAGGTWTRVSKLPSSYDINGAQRVTVYSSTSEVWKQNAAHKTKYKKTTPAPKGKAVGYKGTNPKSTKVYKKTAVHESHGGRGNKGKKA